tara:strand:+ start:95 stop:445 length:351 start_codon:yes stop_codon:yes gene_type:complete
MPPSEKNKKIKNLKGKTKFDLLFKEGEVNHEGDLLMKIKKDPSMDLLEVGVSVSKKLFIRAVDRNYIKRLMRASLKKIEKDLLFDGVCLVMYTGKEIPEIGVLSNQMQKLFRKYMG